jgi:hypothetical protein
MPLCKKDKTKSYKGTEPSPKGFGYCAHSEKEGTIMKGTDGNNWKCSSSRWIKMKEYNINKLVKKLFDKLYKWWKDLSIGKFIIVYKDNTYKIKKEIDDDSKYIIWGSRSTDDLTFFINYILYKKSNEVIEELIKSKNTLVHLIDNFKSYFVKSMLNSNKDYTLKSKENINDKKILSKVMKSEDLKRYL